MRRVVHVGTLYSTGVIDYVIALCEDEIGQNMSAK